MAKAVKKGTPGWKQKVKKIDGAIVALEKAMTALKSAQKTLNEVVDTDPGGGPTVRD